MAKKKNKADEAPAAAPVQKTEPFKTLLKVQLKREEVESVAEEAAELLGRVERENLRIEEKKAEFKGILTTMRSDVAKIRDSLGDLSRQVLTKTTHRDVVCERRYDFTTNTIIEVRLDTGEEITRRPMSDAEKQPELPFDSGGGGKKPDLDDDFSGPSDP